MTPQFSRETWLSSKIRSRGIETCGIDVLMKNILQVRNNARSQSEIKAVVVDTGFCRAQTNWMCNLYCTLDLKKKIWFKSTNCEASGVTCHSQHKKTNTTTLQHPPLTSLFVFLEQDEPSLSQCITIEQDFLCYMQNYLMTCMTMKTMDRYL